MYARRTRNFPEPESDPVTASARMNKPGFTGENRVVYT